MPPADPPTYRSPRLAINRVYTRKGDKGMTALVGGQKVRKDALRIEAYGTVDELNAQLGVARAWVGLELGRELGREVASASKSALRELAGSLLGAQHALFNLGSVLATKPEDVGPQQPQIDAGHVRALEVDIDRCQETLQPLASFVLPGSHPLEASLHVGRTICRRAERLSVSLADEEHVSPEALAYLNRLSDALFVWGRLAAKELGAPETLWQPNQAQRSD